MVGIKYNIFKSALLFSLILASSCVPLQTTQTSNEYFPTLQFENTTYQDRIKTVQLIKLKNGSMVEINNPIIELNSGESLLLTFDDLTNEQQLYQAKIIHMNKDWTAKSQVLPMNYMEGYNQIAIQNYEYSFDTKVPYIQYSLKVPSVKVSGNYLLIVYKGNNEEDIILTERFSVYENKTLISYKLGPSSLVKNRRNMQEIELEVGLNGANILNRGADIYPIIRQNNNWLNAVRLQEPRFIQGESLQYIFFDGTLNFPGANEFRFVDISTVNFKGTNISTIYKEENPIVMLTGLDQNRSNQAYREWQDRNGKFFIGNRERQTQELVNDYIEVTFQLKVPQQNEPIYIVGEFNNWETNNHSMMSFNINQGIYQSTYLLKQGYYEYIYYTKQAPHYEYEGSYVDTENEYDIAIYYSNPQLRYDQLIGYTQFNSRSARQNK